MEAKTVKTSLERLSPILHTMLEEGIDVTLTITGNSMLPLLRHGKDKVVLCKCKADALKKGDLPLYQRQSGQYVLHRIWAVHERTYDMVGDGQITIERGLPKQQILAVVKKVERKGKWYDCRDWQYGWYVKLWGGMFPIRRVLLRLGRSIWK